MTVDDDSYIQRRTRQEEPITRQGWVIVNWEKGDGEKDDDEAKEEKVRRHKLKPPS